VCDAGVVLRSTQHEMMLVTQHKPDSASYIVCIQNLPVTCTQSDVVDLLNSMSSHTRLLREALIAVEIK